MTSGGFLRHRSDRDRGAAAVEFALVLLPLLTLVLGTMQYGWYFFTAQSASSAAREATRQLAVGNCQGAAAETYAQRQANVMSLTLEYGEADPGDPTAIISPSTLPDIGDVLRVVVEADGKIIGFLPMPNNGHVVRTVDARVDDDTASGTC